MEIIAFVLSSILFIIFIVYIIKKLMIKHYDKIYTYYYNRYTILLEYTHFSEFVDSQINSIKRYTDDKYINEVIFCDDNMRFYKDLRNFDINNLKKEVSVLKDKVYFNILLGNTSLAEKVWTLDFKCREFFQE